MSVGLGATQKRYLFAVYECSRIMMNNDASPSGAVKSKDVAEVLGVKHPSVTRMLKALAEDGLIEKSYYGRIHLTPEGTQIANGLYLHYLALFSVFRDGLGISEECAHRDAITGACGFYTETLRGIEEHIIASHHS